MNKERYQICVNMSDNSQGTYDWYITKYELMAGWYKIQEGACNSPEESFKQAKLYVDQIEV
jgi:hypothetical protein